MYNLAFPGARTQTFCGVNVSKKYHAFRATDLPSVC